MDCNPPASTLGGMVHLNDTGSSVGRDEQVSMANFEQAWGTSNNFAVRLGDEVAVTTTRGGR